jgi:hypothetical protein
MELHEDELFFSAAGGAAVDGVLLPVSRAHGVDLGHGITQRSLELRMATIVYKFNMKHLEEDGQLYD